MKVTIDLSDTQVKAIKQYLKETGDGGPVTNAEVKQYIDGIVFGVLYAPQEAVSHYLQQHESQQ